jgi:succinate dehydrogenase/fumarate reductase cytochrome b subunit
MNICPYCQRTVPGVEAICKDCYERVYANGSLPKPTLVQLIRNSHSKPIPDTEPSETVRVPAVVWLPALVLGLILYLLFSFGNPAIGGVVVIVADFVIAYDIFDSSVRRSRTSIFYMAVVLVTAAFYVVESLTGNANYLNVGAAGACVIAAYILIDHRRVI